MNGPRKRVLVVDDADYIREGMRQRFKAYNNDTDTAYTFEVLVAAQIDTAIDVISKRKPGEQVDVIILDLSFVPEDAADRSGLRLAAALGLLRRLQQEIPISIVFSSYADLSECVTAMRCGAWDVIDKGGHNGETTAYDRVVASAVDGLQALDAEKQLNVAATDWVHRHMTELRLRYGRKVVAIWHDPEVRVVASGADVFELQKQLENWRKFRPAWMDPFVIEIIEMPDSAKVLGGQP